MDLLLYYGFNFAIYGYLGWGLENLFSFYVHGHRQEEGFLYSYFKPMYAFAMTILIYLNKEIHNYLLMLLLCLVIPTVIEFITGVLMRNYFNKDYWDYSEVRFNYKGIICLGFSIYWMALSFFAIKIIQPFIIDYIFKLFIPLWKVLLPIQIIVLIVDFVLTLRRFSLKKKII